ncbi:amidophosphoribosyltransferase [Aestuariibius sp. 2305UL40-4]|uniref:amidophosphoribosyltransferase n=1 Tax=Aestuariibius violaceus TaxID=3234132 RepID=UPI00345E4CF4
MTTTTPPRVARSATTSVRISRRDLTLLGTSGGSASPQALLRRPGGRTFTVRRGDRIGQDIVAAIEPGRVILQRNGRTVELTTPGP